MYYLYTKKKRDYIPVEDSEKSERAKEKLKDIFQNKEKYNIPQRFLNKWDKIALFSSGGEVDKAKALYIKDEETTFDLKNKLNDLSSKEWLSETVTVFTQKGLGAGSKDAEIERLHPAPFSFQDVARLIRFFTKEGDKVLDPFAGVASTLKACAMENRVGYGIELSEKYFNLGKERIKVEIPDTSLYKNQQFMIHGDSVKRVKKFEKGFFDFIITSPPYWNILETIDHKVKENRIANDLDIKYSEDDVNDLGNVEDYDKFLKILSTLFDNCSEILGSKKYLCVIVSDFRKKEKYHLFHADLAKEIEKKGNFNLKGIRILHQKFKSIYPYGYPFTFVPNVHHQNVLIFQKNS